MQKYIISTKLKRRLPNPLYTLIHRNNRTKSLDWETGRPKQNEIGFYLYNGGLNSIAI